MKIYKWLFNEIIKISTKHAVMLAFLIMLQNITKPLELLAYKNIVWSIIWGLCIKRDGRKSRES